MVEREKFIILPEKFIFDYHNKNVIILNTIIVFTINNKNNLKINKLMKSI